MEKNLIDIIAQSGIVGAGGAGFPTHVKVNAKAEYVILNGAAVKSRPAADGSRDKKNP